MNLGQFLTARSPLPSGTVAQHLAAIASSAGTGANQIIYCSQINTLVDEKPYVIAICDQKTFHVPPARIPHSVVFSRQSDAVIFGGKPFEMVATRNELSAFAHLSTNEVTALLSP